MKQLISLGLVLFGTWLLLSGVYDNPLLIGLGVASVAIVVAVARHMGLIDREGHPLDVLPRIPLAWAWLFGQIMLANLDVVRRVLAPRPRISPTLVRIPTRLGGDDLGRVTYANWITLTPGTVSVTVERDTLLVHALSREGAAALATGDMERRVIALVGTRAR